MKKVTHEQELKCASDSYELFDCELLPYNEMQTEMGNR